MITKAEIKKMLHEIVRKDKRNMSSIAFLIQVYWCPYCALYTWHLQANDETMVCLSCRATEPEEAKPCSTS